MTRINVIPVDQLTDQHLVAEYREMLMVPASLKRSLGSKNGMDKKRIPNQYTLNTGHVYFFYDKGKFLKERYDSLVNEMKKRGMKPDPNRTFPTKVFKDNDLYNSWKVTDRAVQINNERIIERINQKPDWYRRTKHKRK